MTTLRITRPPVKPPPKPKPGPPPRKRRPPRDVCRCACGRKLLVYEGSVYCSECSRYESVRGA